MVFLKKCGILVLSLALAGCGCGSSKKEDKSSQAVSSVSKSEQVPSEASSQTTGSDTSKSEQEAESGSKEDLSSESSEAVLVDGIEFSVSPVPQDVNGNWRLSIIYSNLQPQDYALDYYNTYMKDLEESEVHFVINRADNTTTVINVLGNLIDLRVLKYVEDEEKSAKALGGGDLIADYWVDIDTGEVEKIE